MTNNQKALEIISAERNLQALAACAAGFGPAATDCELKVFAIQKLQCYLMERGYLGGSVPTKAEAESAAHRVWGEDVPHEIWDAIEAASA